MKIGIIGAGMIGGTAARLFAEAGHDVALSNSRGPESLKATVDAMGPRVRAATVEEAASFADVVLLAVPWRKPEALPRAETVNGKIVIDAMNPYGEGGQIENLQGLTSSEHTRRRMPGARLVKAFNTIWYKHLAESGRKDLPVADRRAIFIAGDDGDAKEAVRRLVEDIGFGAVDLGGLAEGGRRQEPGSPIYNRVMTVKDAQQPLE